MATTENKPSLSKYEEALAKYNTNIDDNDVREAVKKIITEKVPAPTCSSVTYFYLRSTYSMLCAFTLYIYSYIHNIFYCFVWY